MIEGAQNLGKSWFAASVASRTIFSLWNRMQAVWMMACRESFCLNICRQWHRRGIQTSARAVGIIVLVSTVGNGFWEWPGLGRLNALWLIPRLAFLLLGILFILAGPIELRVLLKGSKVFTRGSYGR